MSKSATPNKKNSSKRGQMRDIASKKTREEDAFVVKPIISHKHSQENNDDLPLVEPLHDETPAEEIIETVEENVDSSLLPSEEEMDNPKEFIKVKFTKFVQLIASHNFDEVMKNNENEDVVLSSNLLTELASAHDEKGERKIPLVFLVGLAIGVVLTYILLTKN